MRPTAISGAAELSNGEIGYYTAVATAIPVLLVAYVVGVRDFVADSILPRIQNVTRGYTRRFFEVSRDVHDIRKALRALVSPFIAIVYQAVVVGLFVVVALLPAAGETASLRALYEGIRNPELQRLSEIGIIAAGIVVLFPLILHVARGYLFSTSFDFVGIAIGMLITPSLVLLVLARSKAFRFAVDRNVGLTYVTHDEVLKDRGADKLDEFFQVIWGGEPQKPGRLSWIDERSVLVFDRVREAGEDIGATRYERHWFKIVQVTAYANASDAEVVLAQERDASLDG